MVAYHKSGRGEGSWRDSGQCCFTQLGSLLDQQLQQGAAESRKGPTITGLQDQQKAPGDREPGDLDLVWSCYLGLRTSQVSKGLGVLLLLQGKGEEDPIPSPAYRLVKNPKEAVSGIEGTIIFKYRLHMPQ